jgi:hypothetical protein
MQDHAVESSKEKLDGKEEAGADATPAFRELFW